MDMYLRWWRKMNDRWFFSRVDNGPRVLDLRRVELLAGPAAIVTLLGRALVRRGRGGQAREHQHQRGHRLQQNMEVRIDTE